MYAYTHRSALFSTLKKKLILQCSIVIGEMHNWLKCLEYEIENSAVNGTSTLTVALIRLREYLGSRARNKSESRKIRKNTMEYCFIDAIWLLQSGTHCIFDYLHKTIEDRDNQLPTHLLDDLHVPLLTTL